MRQLDLFAGIGGITLAAEWAGIETVAFCEKEPFAQGILRRRFPGRPIYDDIFDLTREVLEGDGIVGSAEGIDIVAGGFPCQPFSNAGKRTGTNDDRYLWPQMCRIVGELRPTWVFAENVDGLVSMAQSGGDLVMEDETTICTEAEMVIETIRKDLEEIGYQSVPVIIPACSVGASHRRYRIFILGYSERSGFGGHRRGISTQQPANGYSELEGGAVAFSDSIGGSPREESGQQTRGTARQSTGDSRSDVADSSGERCGEEARRHSDRSEEWASGSGETVADSERITARGLPIREGEAEPGSSFSSQDAGNEVLVDASSSGLSESAGRSRRETDVTGFEHRGILGSRETSGGPAQSGVGGSPYELSDWLDGWGMNPLDALFNFIASYPQPALMGQEQHDWEPPRVATGIKNRAARLKALGNAVDPLQALPVLYGIRIIDEYLRGRRA